MPDQIIPPPPALANKRVCSGDVPVAQILALSVCQEGLFVL